MSDINRQSFTDKAASKMKPDSEQSIPEKVANTVKSVGDNIAAKLQPNESKSTTQKMADKVSGKD